MHEHTLTSPSETVVFKYKRMNFEIEISSNVTMSSKQLTIGGFNDYRGVSQIVAIALMLLTALGFIVVIQGIQADITDTAEDPPSAKIQTNPGVETVKLKVRRTKNADTLRVVADGMPIVDEDNDYNDENLVKFDGIDDPTEDDHL